MANYICYPLTKVPEHLIEKVVVPSATTYRAGDIVMAETLKSGSREVYTGAAIGTVASSFPAIVINQGFEQLADGRRPAGQPDPGKFEYTEGDVITVVRLDKHLKFFISNDAITATSAIAAGKVLVPKTATQKLECLAAPVGTEAVVANIELVETNGNGGLFGFDFVTGVIARVSKA